ncbi:MAG: modification methylase [Solirubrobacterales bacterium]|nr:modification methylase [Solirubrobacterales bacterium]
MTTHSLVENDCRNLSFIPDASVHLIITHPPAFGSFGDSQALGQFSAIPDYGDYLAELDSVWSECDRVLAPGGHLACVVSPVARCDEDLPLTADIHARTRRFGLDVTRAIRWFPQDRAELDDTAFYGAPNQPCGELLCDSQDVLVMRKPGERLVSVETQVSSRMPADYFATTSSSVWLIPAESDPRHPHCFPLELAERLIRMFSYAGDTVLDPFAGIGTTSAAAGAWGRNSIAVEIEQRYFDSMADRMSSAEWPDGEITITRGPLMPNANRSSVALPAV